MKCYLIIILAFITVELSAQIEPIDSKRICRQIEKSIEHLTREKELRLFKITANNILRNGFGYSSMSSEYVAGKLNVDKESIFQQDQELVNKLFRQISALAYDSIVDYKLSNCQRLKIKNKNTNTILSKVDNDTLLYHIQRRNKGKRGPSGYIYLFFFDKEDNVSSVFKTNWIE